MDDVDEFPIRGTGPRLISLAEAAEIWQVEEQAVRDWIEGGLISYVTLPGGRGAHPAYRRAARAISRLQ